MADDFAPLLADIRRVFPSSSLTTLGDAQLATIRDRYPGVPDHYLAFLRTVGWGRLGNSNFMVYSGPIEPSEFFGPDDASCLVGILFFGDNFSGWHVGFDTRNGWELVGVDSASPDPFPEEATTIAEFIAGRVSNYGHANGP
jgi:hypothetical protein